MDQATRRDGGRESNRIMGSMFLLDCEVGLGKDVFPRDWHWIFGKSYLLSLFDKYFCI